MKFSFVGFLLKIILFQFRVEIRNNLNYHSLLNLSLAQSQAYLRFLKEKIDFEFQVGMLIMFDSAPESI